MTDLRSVESINGVYIPGRPSNSLWDIHLGKEKVSDITPHSCQSTDACKHRLILNSMTHPHIHLDKAFLISSAQERYQDLVPQNGSFKEALTNTAAAKSRFTADDLFQRGSWLIAESIAAGVTAMRAFVEVDETVKLSCIHAAIRLKQEFKGKCHIQICAFAQDPIFSEPHGATNRSLMEEALKYSDIEALGTTPYVEDGLKHSKENVDWAISTALRTKRHLDFHLDYSLEDVTSQTQTSEEQAEKSYPLASYVVEKLIGADWTSKTAKTIAIGHCTRLTLLSIDQMGELALAISKANLPLTFVGLPSSDLYMMGRPVDKDPNPGKRPRGTLQIPMMIKRHGLNCAIGVNNVGNAFTPYGSLDPLWLACMGVGLYHAGTTADAHLLYQCISNRARRAIGLSSPETRQQPSDLEEGDPIDFIVVECQRKAAYLDGIGRQQTTIEEMVWDPPSIERRQVFFR